MILKLLKLIMWELVLNSMKLFAYKKNDSLSVIFDEIIKFLKMSDWIFINNCVCVNDSFSMISDKIIKFSEMFDWIFTNNCVCENNSLWNSCVAWKK